MAYDPESYQASYEHGQGRVATVPRLTTHEARQEALQLVRRGLPTTYSKKQQVLGILGAAGVILHEQVVGLTGVSERSLRRYRGEGLIDRIPMPRRLGQLLGDARGGLWALGPVGLALSEIRQGMAPKGYLEAKGDHVTHDALCALVYYHIHEAARRLGHRAILYNRYEATVHDAEGCPLLEPDAMIVLRRSDGGRHLFLLEYHNEDFGSRAADKVRRYEEIFAGGRWQARWQTVTPPAVLLAWTHRAVGDAYKAYVHRRGAAQRLEGSYLGKPLHSFLNNEHPLIWLDVHSNSAVNLLDCPTAERRAGPHAR